MNARNRSVDPHVLDVGPSGVVTHKANMKRWLESMQPAPRITVARLSKVDPEIAAFEATSRGARAA